MFMVFDASNSIQDFRIPKKRRALEPAGFLPFERARAIMAAWSWFAPAKIKVKVVSYGPGIDDFVFPPMRNPADVV